MGVGVARQAVVGGARVCVHGGRLAVHPIEERLSSGVAGLAVATAASLSPGVEIQVRRLESSLAGRLAAERDAAEVSLVVVATWDERAVALLGGHLEGR